MRQPLWHAGRSYNQENARTLTRTDHLARIGKYLAKLTTNLHHLSWSRLNIQRQNSSAQTPRHPRRRHTSSPGCLLSPKIGSLAVSRYLNSSSAAHYIARAHTHTHTHAHTHLRKRFTSFLARTTDGFLLIGRSARSVLDKKKQAHTHTCTQTNQHTAIKVDRETRFRAPWQHARKAASYPDPALSLDQPHRSSRVRTRAAGSGPDARPPDRKHDTPTPPTSVEPSLPLHGLGGGSTPTQMHGNSRPSADWQTRTGSA